MIYVRLTIGLSLTPIPKDKKDEESKPKSYTIAGQASDVFHYVAIPLPGIYSAELHVSIGVRSNGSITGMKPCCCLACCSCCGVSEHISTNNMDTYT